MRALLLALPLATMLTSAALAQTATPAAPTSPTAPTTPITPAVAAPSTAQALIGSGDRNSGSAQRARQIGALLAR